MSRRERPKRPFCGRASATTYTPYATLPIYQTVSPPLRCIRARIRIPRPFVKLVWPPDGSITGIPPWISRLGRLTWCRRLCANHRRGSRCRSRRLWSSRCRRHHHHRGRRPRCLPQRIIGLLAVVHSVAAATSVEDVSPFGALREEDPVTLLSDLRIAEVRVSAGLRYEAKP
jgi:hypothetical protein